VEVSTKERLTGALLVVLALIFIAPELLTGRRAPDRGTQPAQNPEDGPPLQTYSIELEAGRNELVKSPGEPATAEIAAVPPPVTGDAPPPVTVTPTPELPAAAGERQPADQGVTQGSPAKSSAAAGKWWVQLGSFESLAKAQALVQRLRDTGFSMDVSRTRKDGKDLYRVRAGPVADRAAARALQTRLVAAGQKDPALIAP
jgi:DedD protein